MEKEGEGCCRLRLLGSEGGVIDEGEPCTVVCGVRAVVDDGCPNWDSGALDWISPVPSGLQRSRFLVVGSVGYRADQGAAGRNQGVLDDRVQR